MSMKRYLTEAEQTRLLAAARRCNTHEAQRDYHWMTLMLALGARVTEFSLLRRGQAELALRTGWLVVAPEQRKAPPKGRRKGHEYVVTATVRTALQALLAMAPEHTDQPGSEPLVWNSHVTGPLSVRSYQARIKVWLAAAGLDPRLSPHSLRHSRAMNVLRRSRGAAPLRSVQEALGHASLGSTGQYLRMSREEFEADMHQVDGRRMPKATAVALSRQHQTAILSGATA
jgi:site-specific recombinase XerD